ncbi:MAG TPA: MBL fold metallo-hydrolase [Ornithinimicrobium sp.]|uniref:MBL fold metallo-hydrolase n=1 Tax=Ornithinimicrobium sp. TaxID=1977084 RepID=UPI002B47C8E5|nr:MBL fold metallo-hydrolase [Ornithinimicrobium sp.]HKJ12362.1 MBL fold metallo-hydrolase [Ornithinimicrobium sp.]
MRSGGQQAAPEDAPWAGGRFTERAWCQLCPNPSPMTLEGTNTWILAEPGSTEAVVVDPGPLHAPHAAAVLAHVQQTGRRVGLILLTHHHDDHAESAGRFSDATGAPVRALGRGHDDLADGDRLRVGGLELSVVTTPGHTADSVSFLLPAEQVLLTGDTVLGRGTTVVAHPDGELEAYLQSLRRLEDLTRSGRVSALAPGHGPVLPDAAATVRSYLSHRKERLEQVRAALGRLGEPPVADADLAGRVVQDVYAEVPRQVWPAARRSVLAQLAYLREQ